MDFTYRVSVIVPIYNQIPYLHNSIESLLKQTISADEMEILLIDDGSTDGSSEICDTYAAENKNVFVIHKENGGLSDARNCGIEHAHGKYLMYLDGDDILQEDTVEAVTTFFDSCYDEVDLVSYPSISVKNGKKIAPHYRYQTFKESGVFDLTAVENIYAGITRIEVCVKNLGINNIRFSENRDFRHEDQKYCIDIILPKLKIGYCSRGAYVYEQQPEGLQTTFFHAYYLFENTTSFWEEEFNKYSDSEVPQYLQALYVSDVSWKLRSSVLLPYHYDKEQFDTAVNRLVSLLNRVDVGVIARHPAVDSFQMAFLLQKKSNCKVELLSGSQLVLAADNEVVYSREKVEIILLRTIPNKNKLTLIGFLKSPCFQFGEKPALFANVFQDGIHNLEEVELSHSSWEYYRAKLRTNVFWNFSYTLKVEESGAVEFLVEFAGQQYKTSYYYMPRAIFSRSKPVRGRFLRDGYEYRFVNNSFHLSTPSSSEAKEIQSVIDSRAKRAGRRVYFTRRLAERFLSKGQRIWLYHDCHGVEKNNAYYQYMHDIEKNDGVERYYVVNDPLESKRHLFTKSQMKNVIEFKGRKHKLLFLAAEKIITAYVEQPNWMPFTPKAMNYYQDIFRAEVVYLQHGVLHSHQPWKYSLDRLLIDKEVVSTRYEIDNLCSNYCFTKNHLIEAGMPRYDFLDPESIPKRKILFAPSWRKFLVRQKEDGQWEGVPRRFADSKFYLEVKKFLESEELAKLLDDNDYYLDMKLHPILNELYADYLQFDNPRIQRAEESVNEEEYAIFITDFSSYRFDFVYLKRAIMYFLPDEDMFKSGMCDYRETDLPLEGMFGDMARAADEAITLLKEIMERDGKPKSEYLAQMDGFFLNYDNLQRDRIYQVLIGEVQGSNA